MSRLLPNPPRKIGLYLGVEPRAGGMFQYAQSVLEGLSKLDSQRYAVTIAYSNNDWAPILARLGLQGHVLCHAKIGQRLANVFMAIRVPALASRILGRYVNPLVHELLALKCDAWIFPAQESLSYQMPTHVIAAIHDLMHRYEPNFPEVSSKFRYAIREHRFRNIAQFCTAVLVDSKVGKRHVVESYGVSPDKIYPLPYVYPSYLDELSERRDFDSYYRLPKKFLFYPAQFWLHKNHIRLIDAVKLVAKTYPDIALVLSGSHRHAYKQIQSHVCQSNLTEGVHFVGYVPEEDLRGFYMRARALVMPTFFGPTNIPPLEALALGCPAVVSGIYGMPEQLGSAALYFNPNSVQDMADRISEIWRDDALAAELSYKGKEYSRINGRQKFSQRFLEILDSIYQG